MAEGNSFVEVNRDGLRDREHSRIKPAETLRIAVLGDSYAEALAIPISVLDLAPQLQAYADSHRAFLHGFRNTTLASDIESVGGTGLPAPRSGVDGRVAGRSAQMAERLNP
jgi:hypothetical protein